jgi:hypothetical protein
MNNKKRESWATRRGNTLDCRNLPGLASFPINRIAELTPSHRPQWRRLSVIEPNDTMNYSHRISRRGPKNTYAHSMDSVSEKISRTSARIAMVGRLINLMPIN